MDNLIFKSADTDQITRRKKLFSVRIHTILTKLGDEFPPIITIFIVFCIIISIVIILQTRAENRYISVPTSTATYTK